MLPPYSPKTPLVPNIKHTHRQRMVNSEPRKIGISSANTSTLQRRLPFERMMSHKTHKYLPPI